MKHYVEKFEGPLTVLPSLRVTQFLFFSCKAVLLKFSPDWPKNDMVRFTDASVPCNMSASHVYFVREKCLI